ncbi:MAG: hypothetical protein J6N93_02240 [Clostridia bacterium]|nr:hypothetical protein [Clostridia bacterium]
MRKAQKQFDVSLPPRKPAVWTKPVVAVGSFFLTLGKGGKVNKINCEGLKPPFIMLSTHASMIDFAMAVKATFPNTPNWVTSIEEFVGREWLLREVGCIYKRKFTSDITVVKHILNCLIKLKNTVNIYPEARFSLAGINERVDGALGKLVKKAKVPLVIFKTYGNFLLSPQWNKHPYRDVKVHSDMIQVVTKEEVETLSAEEIQRRIEENFAYDDYAWQYENKIRIKSKYRAYGIHKILYQCPHCKTEYSTKSQFTEIWCEACGKKYVMDEYGRLSATEGETEFEAVPDWYKWERQNVVEEVNGGRYKFEDDVRVEWLKSSADGCVPIGTVKLTHDYNGFNLKGKLDDGSDFELARSPETMRACHIEYDYKERGNALELCTLKNTYFVFPHKFNTLTKLHFATEAIYDYTLKRNEEKHKNESL